MLRNGENIFLGSIYKKKQLYLIVKKASGLLAQVSKQELQTISSIDEIEQVILQRNKEKFEFCGTIFIKKTIILVFKSYYTKFREIEVTKQSEIIQDEKYIVYNELFLYKIPLTIFIFQGGKTKEGFVLSDLFPIQQDGTYCSRIGSVSQKKKHYKYILLWDCCKIIQNSKKIILEQKLKNMSRIPLSDITSTNKILKTKWTQSASKLTRTSIRSEIEKPIISEVRVQDRQTQTQMPLINLYHMPTPLRRSYMLALITMIVLILYFLTNIFELFRDEEILCKILKNYIIFFKMDMYSQPTIEFFYYIYYMKQKSLTMYGSFTRCESSSTRTSSVYGGNENRQYAQLDVIDEIIFENDLQSSEKDSETIMTSKYVIQVYDENHLNKIQIYEHDIFNSLLCQVLIITIFFFFFILLLKKFIPVVFQDDIDLHKPNNTVPIILDYFTYNHNIGKSQEILSFEYLLMGRKSLQKITQHSASRKSTSSFKQHIRERSKSAQYICRTKFQNRELIVLNIDQKDQNEPKQEIPIKEVHQSITRGFYNQDEKSSPFYLQNEICIKTLLTLAFTSEDQQFFGLLVYSYQLFYENHVDFLKEVIKLYYSKKQQIDSQSNILRYLCFWIDLRSKDLMEDRDNIFQIVGCFCQIAQLLNYGKSAMIEKQINTLSQKATSIVELRNTLFKLQLQRPQRKRRNSEEIQNKNSRQKKQHRKQQSHQFTKQSFQGIIAQYEFNDWSFYLQTPTIVLQRQLWIIDVEYFKKISITDLLNIQNGSSRALKEIADHFDYLLFHMVCSTIKCPKDQLSYLFQKFIILFQICMDAQHYQMCYLLQEYFNHVTDYLDYSYHLPYTHWQILKQIQSFDYQDKYIQYFQVNASIPVMAILQNQIYKLSKFEQHINISRLDNLSLNLFQIGNLLYYEQKCQYDQFKQEVEYQFLKVHTKQSIQKFFNNTNKYCIQLELLRLK